MANERRDRTIVVFGATGTQGGGVVENLLASDQGWRVRGVTRDPGSERARVLAERGVEVVRADLNEPSTLSAAIAGAYGVFSVQGEAPEDDPALETRQGRAVIDAALGSDVEHLVYASSCGAKEPGRGVSYWDAKRAVADYLMGTMGLRWTIVRPVSFMENYVADRGALERGVIPGMLSSGKTLQVISGHDIGKWVTAAFERADEFAGEAVDIGSETVTMDAIADTLGRVLGREIVYRQLPRETWESERESARAMTSWYERHGYDEDIEALVGRWGVRMLPFEDWLRAVWLPRSGGGAA